jgi:FkbM family methyltransferase
VSRRLDRPELLAVFEAKARQARREEVGISAALAIALGGEATYVDVGCNHGQVLREAVRVAPHARHIAFEPIPALASDLAREFPNVDCRCKAIGSTLETAEFCYFRELDGWSGLRRNPEISDERGRPELIEVEVSTLDEELSAITPTVIKIDVEGAELAVLEGGREVLSEARPLLIFEHVPDTDELYGDAPGAVWDLLNGLGYDIFAATGDGPFARTSFLQNDGVVNWLGRPGPFRRLRRSI